MKKLLLILPFLLVSASYAQPVSTPIDLDKMAETMIAPDQLDVFHHIRLVNTEMNVSRMVKPTNDPKFADTIIYADNPENWNRLITYQIVPLEKGVGKSIQKSQEVIEEMSSNFTVFDRYTKVGLTGAMFYGKFGIESVIGYITPLNTEKMIIVRYHTKGMIYYDDVIKMGALSGLSPRVENFFGVATQ